MTPIYVVFHVGPDSIYAVGAYETLGAAKGVVTGRLWRFNGDREKHPWVKTETDWRRANYRVVEGQAPTPTE